MKAACKTNKLPFSYGSNLHLRMSSPCGNCYGKISSIAD